MTMRLKIPGIMKAVQSMPWAIMQEKLDAIMELLELRAEGGILTREEVEARIGEPKKVTAQKQGVVAVIPIYGVISQRMNMFSEISGGTSTEQIAKQFDSALNDSSVAAILFDVDSPGGSVYGVSELAAKIYGARGRKPIKAIANPLMASAAYFIASAADEVIAASSGDVGSIGVFAVHTDVSGMDAMHGVKRTLIKAGKYKAEGNYFTPLSEDARAHMQEMVNDSYDDFVEAVARHRGATPAAVRAGYGQGRVLTAKRAIAENLIDRVATLDQVLEELGAVGPAEARTRSAEELPPEAVSKTSVVVRVAIADSDSPADVAQADVNSDTARDDAGAQPIANDTRDSSTASEARETTMSVQDTAAREAATTTVAVGTDHAAEATRATQIFQTCAAHGLTAQQAQEYVRSGKSAHDVGLDIAEKKRAGLQAMTAAAVDLNQREVRRYSITRGILAAVGRQDGTKFEDDGFEREISDEIKNRLPKDYKYSGGLLVPHRVKTADMGRGFGFAPGFMFSQEQLRKVAQFDPGLADRMAALNTGSATAGGNTVFTEGRELIDFLYARMKVAALGATILSGLRGPVAFPRQTASSAWTWVAENPGSDVADSDATIGQVLLSPKTGQASTAYSRQLLNESSIDVDGFVQADLQMGAALGIDKAAIQGTGASNQPLGLTGISGVNLVAIGTNGGAPTYAFLIDMETEVANDNADIGTMGYLTTPGIRGKLKKTETFATTNGMPVWLNGEVNGYRAEASTQVPSALTKGTSTDCHAILFGVWSQLLIGYWGAYELVVDPYRLKKQGLIEVTSFQMAGIAARNPESFCKIVDARVV